ncbi:hypothetical protein HanRHA438_Chr14g0661881 [Helianthus annuus]|nr:hypothetical protein HanRHA438_Chr14g0661881 [Helianthus annuus]
MKHGRVSGSHKMPVSIIVTHDNWHWRLKVECLDIIIPFSYPSIKPTGCLFYMLNYKSFLDVTKIVSKSF